MQREFWLNHADIAPSPLAIKPRFIPDEFANHLLLNKKYESVKKKYIPGDSITNMQACFHCLVVPIVYPLYMNGKLKYKEGHYIDPLGVNEPPVYILSMLVNPDFEFKNVMYEMLRLETHEIAGKDLDNWDSQVSEQRLKEWFIYKFCPNHVKPSASTSTTGTIGTTYGEICVPALFKLQRTQIELEMHAIDLLETEEIVYTWDPPLIFAKCIDYELLDEGWARAIVDVISTRIKLLVFNDFRNKKIISFLKSRLEIPVISKSEFYKTEMTTLTLIHTNSDAFGEHVLSQPMETSLEGAIGSCSSAAASVCTQKKFKLVDI